MYRYQINHLLASQSSPNSEVSLRSDRQLWAGEVGQSWAQLPLAEPMTSPEILYANHQQYTQYIETPPYSPILSVPQVNPLAHNALLPGSVPSVFSHQYIKFYLAILANQCPLPYDFPAHADSVLAELFPVLVSRHSPASVFRNPLSMLDSLRKQSGESHLWDIEEMPTMFAYAHVTHFSDISGDPLANSSSSIPVVLTRFGVSAPRETHLHRGSQIPNGLSSIIRAYRIRRGWGIYGVEPDADLPPKSTESWHHGHCAEMQAIPPVVEWCEHLGLENVDIYSLSPRLEEASFVESVRCTYRL